MMLHPVLMPMQIHSCSHAYFHIDTSSILHSMDHNQIPPITQNMSFTDVYPVNDQQQEDPTWHQSPPLLLAFSTTFSPHNLFLNYLPNIPSSSNNDQHHHFPSNNEQNCPFLLYIYLFLCTIIQTVLCIFAQHRTPSFCSSTISFFS